MSERGSLMHMPNIIGLHQAEWNKSTPTDRLKALNELESFMASQDGRTPCSVQMHEIGFMRGQYDQYGQKIDINTFLIEDPRPYQAVETLFHEDRHAHQHHVVNNPELADNPTQLKDWEMGEIDAAYIQPGDLNYSTYRWQPTETDANQSARSNTDGLYQDTFQDTDNYPVYKAIKEQEIAEQKEYAQFELGEDYEEQARQAVQLKYQAQQAIHQEETTGIEDVVDDIPEEDRIPSDKSHFTQETLEAEVRADEQLAAEEADLDERIAQIEAELEQEAKLVNSSAINEDQSLSQQPQSEAESANEMQENSQHEASPETQSNSQSEIDDPSPSNEDYYGYGY